MTTTTPRVSPQLVVTEHDDPALSSLVASVYASPDHADRFAANVPAERFPDVDAAATAWFAKQPTWIRVLSTNSMLRGRVIEACRDSGFAPGTSIGSWEVISRNDEEIVFGDHLGFMEFRTSFRLIDHSRAHESDTRSDGVRRLEVSTVVRYAWRRTGRFYFALVRPFHRRFIVFLLRTTVG